jgi:colanic acid/amylovoran biosynthesis protein
VGDATRLVFVGNGTYANRGCEAILRGTMTIMRSTFARVESTAIDFGSEPDRERHEEDPRHRTVSIDRFSPAWFAQNAGRLVGGFPWFPHLGRAADEADAVLALGGDNYSMDYGSLRSHLAVIDCVVRRDTPFVIWGASVGPFTRRGATFERRVSERIGRASAIMVREELSYDYLSGLGLDAPIMRMADPAFLMDAEEPPHPPLSQELLGEAVGLNWSPVLSRLVFADAAAGAAELRRLVQALVRELDRPVVCVPHVFKRGNDDFIFMRDVLGDLIDEERVFLVPPGFSAAQYKWIIGNTRLFIGARTHSTIAALSSEVPTLCLAYSIKARGVARDVMGSDDFVLEGAELTANAITGRAREILQDEERLRARLSVRVVGLEEEALSAGHALREVIGGSKAGGEAGGTGVAGVADEAGEADAAGAAGAAGVAAPDA